jgi:hypothetical protein
MLLLLPGVPYLSNPNLNPIWQLKSILFGFNPSIIPGGGYGYALFGALFRDLCFVDGTLWWSIMAGVFAITPGAQLSNTSERRRQRDRVLVQSLKMALMLSLPTILLRTIGLGPLGDLVRIPTLFVALCVIRERQSFTAAIQKSWSIVRPQWSQVVLVFLFSLLLLRIVEVTPLVIQVTAQYWQPEFAQSIADQARISIAIFTFFTQLAIAPVVHIIVAHMYESVNPLVRFP